MNIKRRKKPDIVIDENTHKDVPGILQRMKHTLIAIFMGIVFAQVMLFAFGFGSVVLLWIGNIKFFFIAYLISCGILGWIVGEKFIQTLNKKIENWWDLWNYWRM